MAADMRNRHRPWVNPEVLMDNHAGFDVPPPQDNGHGGLQYQFPMMPGAPSDSQGFHPPRRQSNAGYPFMQMRPPQATQPWGQEGESALHGQDFIPSFRQPPHLQTEAQDPVDHRQPSFMDNHEPRQPFPDQHDHFRKPQLLDYAAKMAKLESPLTAPSQPINDTLENLVAEKDTSGNPVSFNCNRCGMSFSKRKNLMQHVRSVHTDGETYTCELCNIGYDRKDMLIQHLRTKHRDRRLYECNICPAVPFFNSQNLEKHKQMVHEDRRPYACNRCEFAFTTKNNLEKHIRTVHERIRPFRCPRCTSCFDTRNNLQKHVRTVHDKQRPYECDRCDTSFGQKSHLDRHVRTVHENYRPFHCPYCSSCFGRKSHLQVHIRTVHENLRPFACDVCGATFGEKGTLTTHTRRIHKKQTTTTTTSPLPTM